ncbi:MAG: HEAT repeat domain-containing protein [Deltaproteobacteria bacterium]|nr:HEAT repeat domain-containing protein [Deltaproteobacteria bacterium]
MSVDETPDPRLDTAAGLRELARDGRRDLLGAVMTRAVREAPEALAVAAADCLGSFADPRAELALVRLLRHRALKARLAAAAGLAKFGTPRCLPALARAKSEVRFGRGSAAATFEDAETRVRARASRAGALSVTDAGGGLSSALEVGALSEVEGRGP